MALEFFLPLIANILQGGVANAVHAGQAARANNENARLARLRRRELQPLIDSLRQARDHTQLEEQLVRDFSRASDQMAAQGAQTGMTNAGSGGLDQVRRDTLGAMLAQLAQVKAQDDAQRQALLADLLSDPLLYEGERPSENVGLTALLGGLGGGLAGAGSTLSSFLSTKEGIEVLRGLGASRADPNLMNAQLFQGQSAVAPGGRHVFNDFTRGSAPRVTPSARPPSFLGGTPWTVTPVP